jgi:uncharacterized OB-fold protein
VPDRPARRRPRVELVPPTEVPGLSRSSEPTPRITVAAEPEKPKRKGGEGTVPFLLDFFPLETPDQTRLSAFYDALRAGRFVTTRCPNDRQLLWPPRVACPKCHTETLEWVDLPTRATIYAFSALLAGAPLGMEADVPFVVGLVDLEGVPLRLFGRIVGKSWQECRIGDPVRVETFALEDGRYFYRFRTE